MSTVVPVHYPRVEFLAMASPVSHQVATNIYADEVRGRAIGEAYLAASDWPAAAVLGRTVAAYRAFIAEVDEQYRYLTERFHVRVDAVSFDPYARATDMADDLRENKHLSVLSTATTGGHPLMSDQENDRFRAVHDAFGHAAIGRGFDRHSEEAAWWAHSHMFSPLARRALTTETRGQNSAFTWVIRGSEFPVQKITLLPSKFVSLAGVRTYSTLIGAQK